jgi:hypothetical protein
MSGETSGNPLDATVRDFANGQKVFSRYTLVKTLGRGGMGVVWLARDEELERNVALKFLPDLIVHDRAVLGDMKRETRRSLDLTHKNIVRIYDFVHSDQSGCISMEYVDGDTLSNLRADKSNKIFESHDLQEWTSQLCDALDYAHTHARITHRDLKPGNLMVNTRGDLKVADFGISRSLSDSVSMLTMEQGRSGTLVFMSPQQLDGERTSHLDDVYSFGATVYELLTSKPPFSSGNIDRQIREKIPPSMSDRRKELEIVGEPIDDVWEKVVAACLAKDPAHRPQSFAEIAQRLEIASPKTVRAKQAAAKAARSGLLGALKSKPIALYGTAAAGLAVILLAVWFFGLRKSAPAPVAVTSPAPQPATGVTQPVRAPVANNDEQATTALGGVMLKTMPRGAIVTLGGMEAGRSPVTFKGIRAGKYPLRINLEGYVSVAREVEVKPGQFVDLGTIALQRGTDLTDAARPVTDIPRVIPESKSEPPPQQQPANAGALAVPLNDFSGG